MPIDQVRLLCRKFEEEAQKLPGAEERLREACRGKRQGGAGLKAKERRLRGAATAHNEKPRKRKGAPTPLVLESQTKSSKCDPNAPVSSTRLKGKRRRVAASAKGKEEEEEDRP